MLDTVSAFRKVSTEADQAHKARGASSIDVQVTTRYIF